MLKTSIALLLLLFAVPARADLNGFLASLNVQAQADMGGFSIKLGAQFGVPAPQVQTIIQAVAKPADAFMVLQCAEMAAKPPEAALQTYQANKTKGWGVIAQQMGIKPGSPEFHKLKSGDLALTGTRGGKGAAAPAGD